MLTYQDIQDARPVVSQYLPQTLTRKWPLLAQRLGCDFYLKHENHQPTGAFKVRGGVYLLSQLGHEQCRQGIIGCTTGNHGQSLAYAAQIFDVHCVLVVPEKNNPDKCAAMRALGAELIESGSDFDDAKACCESLAAKQGYKYVHSANEPHLIAGVGTMADEIFDAVEHVDVLLVPIGLGSGVCGSGIVAAARSPHTRVVGVQSVGAPAVAESWSTGKTVAYDQLDTFAEGLATRAPAEMTMSLMRQTMHDVILVSDDEIRQSMSWILSDTHNLPEPAGAATTAAAWKMRDQLAGKTVVGVLSGGNCDLRVLRDILPEQSDD